MRRELALPMSSTFALHITCAGPYRLQVRLEPLLLQIKFPFDLAQHFIVDASPVAQSDHGSSLGCEHLLAKTELGLLAITGMVVCGSRFVQTPRVVLDFLLID
jgi:hypothetical protein